MIRRHHRIAYIPVKNPSRARNVRSEKEIYILAASLANGTIFRERSLTAPFFLPFMGFVL